jgi:bleomycin hydrolase
MGSSPSKPSSAPSALDSEKFESSITARTAELADLTLSDTSAASDPTRSPLDIALFSKWEDRLLSDPKNQLALSGFTQNSMLSLIRNRDVVINDGSQVFSNKIQLEGRPITNQRSSGRCWLFAATNVMRIGVMNR